MLLNVVKADGASEKNWIKTIKARASENTEIINRSAKQIMDDVKQNGFKAVSEYSLKFDKNDVHEISESELDNAYKACDINLINALKASAENIREYQKRTLPESWEWEKEKGITLGQIVKPLDRVGVYVPGGTAAYPSSVLMNIIPARIAGVREIIMVTPPKDEMNIAVLAAAKIAGVDRVFAAGGVQAIAALAYGACPIPKVDKIIGPGNAYVAAAKRLAFGNTDIDMIAGPSEILILADESADPSFLGADLLSQAEHDPMSSSILLTTSMKLANDVAEKIQEMTVMLKRKDIIEKSVADFGAAIVFDSIEKAAEMANEIAPEHLEIVTKNPRAVLPYIKNAGAIFLGGYSPEPLGDYLAGPCHVLPTSGTARFFSPLSAESFVKRSSLIEYDSENFFKSAKVIIDLANSEGLDAHANSIIQRIKK